VESGLKGGGFGGDEVGCGGNEEGEIRGNGGFEFEGRKIVYVGRGCLEKIIREEGEEEDDDEREGGWGKGKVGVDINVGDKGEDEAVGE
ncbi:hypothetical protein, partial [Neisseria sicca]|uniref:hypothetical protein n=1 Tax=Neisseria sicca TaxID=490 RepID=UPI0016497B70